MSIEIIVDTSGMDQKIYDIKNGLQLAMKRAAKRAAAHGKTKLDETVRKRIAVPKAAVMQQIFVTKQGNNGHKLTLKKSSRVSLRRFGATQVGKRRPTPRGPLGRYMSSGKAVKGRGGGVTYKISKVGKRGFIPGAFIVEKLNGQVFKRKIGNKSKPIQKIWGPSVWGAFTGGKEEKTVRDATPEVIADIEAKYRERLEHEINYIISQAGE